MRKPAEHTFPIGFGAAEADGYPVIIIPIMLLIIAMTLYQIININNTNNNDQTLKI